MTEASAPKVKPHNHKETLTDTVHGLDHDIMGICENINAMIKQMGPMLHTLKATDLETMTVAVRGQAVLASAMWIRIASWRLQHPQSGEEKFAAERSALQLEAMADVREMLAWFENSIATRRAELRERRQRRFETIMELLGVSVASLVAVLTLVQVGWL